MGLDAVLVATTIISIFINDIQTTNVDSKYVIVDGIKVLRADYEAFSRAEEKKKVQDALEKAKEDLLTKEYRLQEEESEEYAKRFPKRCHVCKIFVEELTEVLERNFTKSKSGEFQITTLEFYDAMDETCENMDKYTVTRVNSFRYKKGASLLRKTFEEAQKDSKIKHWSYTTPSDKIDDPTGEIQRLKEKCWRLTEYHGQKNLQRWLKKHQNENLLKWFCEDIYLKNNKKGCISKYIWRDDEIKVRDELWNIKIL